MSTAAAVLALAAFAALIADLAFAERRATRRAAKRRTVQARWEGRIAGTGHHLREIEHNGTRYYVREPDESPSHHHPPTRRNP